MRLAYVPIILEGSVVSESTGLSVRRPKVHCHVTCCVTLLSLWKLSGLRSLTELIITAFPVYCLSGNSKAGKQS